MKLLLNTERILVRDYVEGDVEDALEFLSNPVTMHYMPEGVFTREQVEVFIQKQMEDPNYFAVVLKAENKVIGHLFFEQYFGEHTYEIGWIFNESYQNKGYCTEAAKEMLDYVFNEVKLHRVVATCQPENIASLTIMEHLGMRKEGFYKECIPVGDEWWDEYAYGILRREWVKHLE